MMTNVSDGRTATFRDPNNRLPLSSYWYCSAFDHNLPLVFFVFLSFYVYFYVAHCASRMCFNTSSFYSSAWAHQFAASERGPGCSSMLPVIKLHVVRSMKAASGIISNMHDHLSE